MSSNKLNSFKDLSILVGKVPVYEMPKGKGQAKKEKSEFDVFKDKLKSLNLVLVDGVVQLEPGMVLTEEDQNVCSYYQAIYNIKFKR